LIETLKDLEKLIKLLRKQGVSEFEHNGTKLKLGDLPEELSGVSGQLEEVERPYQNFPQGELTPEQLLFYSSGGQPEDDPALKETA
jgi:hypothetical protein